MKFFHLSDLHFGKQLQGYHMEEEQRQIIKDIIMLTRKEKPDAVLLCGDVYDRSVPSATAMTLLEELFQGFDKLAQEGIVTEVLLIGGNHDSAQRLAYGSHFLKRHHIHMAVLPPRKEEEFIEKVVLQDAEGDVNFYLLPYTKPGMLRGMEKGEEITSSQEAISFLLQREKIDWTKRNVLLSHQFYVTKGKNPTTCQSESLLPVVGGLDGIDTTTVEKFDYVALGHIHSPQNLGDQHIRYCGTPLKYSVSEHDQNKSLTLVEMKTKGEIGYEYIPFVPKRDLLDLEGTLQEIVDRAKGQVCHDYVRITLHDQDLPENLKEYLEQYYDHILEIQIDNERTRKILQEEIGDIKEMTPMEAFVTFFEDTTGRELYPEEKEEFMKILEEVGEEV